MKVRVAYGKGIRPAEATIRATSWMGMRGSAGASNLSPEEQSGVEAGVDLLVGRLMALHVTRFDQLASGPIQPVAVSSSGPGPGEGTAVVAAVVRVAGAARLTMDAASRTISRTSARSRIVAGRSRAPRARAACRSRPLTRSSTAAFAVWRAGTPATSGRAIGCSRCRSVR